VQYNSFADFLNNANWQQHRPNMHMIKVGGKLEGITPAPWVLPVTDAEDDGGFKW